MESLRRPALPQYVYSLSRLIRTRRFRLQCRRNPYTPAQFHDPANYPPMRAVAQRRTKIRGGQIVEVVIRRIVERRSRSVVRERPAQHVSRVEAHACGEPLFVGKIQTVVPRAAKRRLHENPPKLRQARTRKSGI